jgi:hypothetical protein
MKALFAALILAAPTVFAAGEFTISQDKGTITVKLDGKLYTEYRTDSRVPYLYPLVSASGAVLSRHWPMEKGLGEEEDHPHHRSFWLSHGAVNGHDFWAWTTKDSDPKIEHRGVKTAGPNLFAVNLAWTAAGKTHLTEERSYAFKQIDPETTSIDVTSRLTAADGDATFGDTKEGFCAIRVDRTLRLAPPKGKDAAGAKGHIADSEGRKDGEAWGKKSKWVAFTGPDEKGEPAVIAMFDHPSNLRHPTTWHARDYGLLAANPFGIHDFEGKKDQPHLGDHVLKKGETLSFRYEVILHHGSLESAKLADRWAEFSK